MSNKMSDIDVCRSLLNIIDEMYEADGITPKLNEDPREACHSKTHDCATLVIHPKWGEGKPVYESHAVPTDDGYVAWYDVEFEHGIEKEVPAEDMKIIKLAEHGAVNASEFKPHLMFHPETGEEVEIKKPEDHDKYAKKGYVHDKKDVKPKKVDEAMMDAYGSDESCDDCADDSPEQVEGSVSFSQHKSTDKGSVSIEASGDDMQELAKVLKMAGLTLPKDMAGSVASADDKEPEEEELLLPKNDDEADGDDAEKQDAKQTLVNIIKDKLQKRLK